MLRKARLDGQTQPAMVVVDAGVEIFIVDDDSDVRYALIEIFSFEGYQTRAFASAEQAWHAIDCGARPGVIVLDVWLPGMSGRQFVAKLRASSYAGIPVVVLSGSGWTERTDCDGDAVLQKPIEGTAVVKAVDRLVVRGSGRRDTATSSAVSAAPIGGRAAGHRS